MSVRWTWLCLLLGGAAAFFSYWYRLDTYYVVLYGGGAVLMAMLTMLFDGGIAGDLKEQLLISLQDQIDNVVGPKMARNLSCLLYTSPSLKRLFARAPASRVNAT